MNIRKILQQIGVTLLAISYIGIIYTVWLNRELLNISVRGLQCQVDLLRSINSLQFKNEDKIIDMIVNINNHVNLLQSGISQIMSKVDLPLNVKYIENSNVFVNGILGMGSGTVIKKTDKNMYVLTCYHVVEMIIKMKEQNLNMPTIVGYYNINEDGKQVGAIMYASDIIKYDEENDLALLKTYLVDDKLNEVPIATIAPEKGDVVYSVGNPLGYDFVRTVSKGILSNKIEGFYVSDNTITFGNSGGGLFNGRGELIGVPARVYGYGTTKEDAPVPESSLGMSIDLKIIREFLQDTEIYDNNDIIRIESMDTGKDWDNAPNIN